MKKYVILALIIVVAAVCIFLFVSKSNYVIPVSDGVSLNIDRNAVTDLPNGGAAVLPGSISVSVSYDRCLQFSNSLNLEDVSMRLICAKKYSVEKKDVTLCHTLNYGSGRPIVDTKNPLEDKDFWITGENECVWNYAIEMHDATVCKNIILTPQSKVETLNSEVRDDCFAKTSAN